MSKMNLLGKSLSPWTEKPSSLNDSSDGYGTRFLIHPLMLWGSAPPVVRTVSPWSFEIRGCSGGRPFAIDGL